MISKLFEGQSSYDYLNSQAKSGSGKTGAFVIGSLLRVDSSIDEL
jgi:superfamily II DNA/RNA helicase